MIITGVEVSGIGRFREGARLAGLGPGINVLAAPNEAGKSTLFRALRACFFLRHGARTEALEALASQGASLPARVAVEFRHGSRGYRIEKRFLHGVRATLSEEGRPLAEGRQADERLWELVGLAPRSRGNVEDEAAFGLLWVGQQASFRLDAPSDGAKHLLGGLIAAEIGTAVGGERARLVLERAEAELARLETPKERRPRAGGPWAEAIRRRDALSDEAAGLRRRLDLLDEDVRELAALQAELGRLDGPGMRAGHEASLRAAEAALAEARRAADRLAQARAAAEAAAGRRLALEERLRRLDEAGGREAAARATIDGLEAALRSGDAEIEARTGRLGEAGARLVRAEEGEAALGREGETLARLEAAAEAAEALGDLLSRRDDARAAQARLAAIEAERAAIRATPERVEAADALAREVVRRRAAQEAAAARLTVSLGPGAGATVTVDGEPLASALARPVLAPTRIQVGDLVTVTVSPAGDREAPALAEAERRLGAALSQAGAASPEEARAALARAALLDQERAALRRLLAALPRGPAGEGGLDGLESRIARASGLVRAALAEARLDALPAREALAGRRREVTSGTAAARREREAAAAAHEAARREAARLDAARGAVAARLDAERGALARALAEAGDPGEAARLRPALDAAREAERAALAALAAQEAAAPDPEALARLAARAERLAQALAGHDEARIGLEKRIHALEVGIEREGGGGLGEEHAAAAAELEMAEREVARREDEVEALRLLRDAVQASLAQSRERYLAPVRRHLAPFLGDVFPDGALQLAEDYTPRGLARGGAPERHDLLSEGTREQIAVLVRLALGSLLAERGEPVPVILDDALVFSDDERLDRMFDALSRAGRRHQVIVLTCRARSFAPLGGRVLKLET